MWKAHAAFLRWRLATHLRSRVMLSSLHTGTFSRSSDVRRSWLMAATVVATAALGVTSWQMSLPMAHAEAPEGQSDIKSKFSSTCSFQDMIAALYNVTEANLEGAKQELIAILDTQRVITDLGQRISHSSTEWSPAPRGDEDRYGIIVCPRSTEEVSAIVRICHRRRLPMTGFSGGTSLEGTLAATQGGVCVDFRLMNKIIDIRKDDLDATVQPGVGYEDLNSAAAAHGLFFPPDPGPGAQIGGMISQSCSGTNAYRYGTVKDWVLGLTLVLADGNVVKTRARPRKSNCGYDLTRLIVGSEGTLAFVTEANLKLTGLPENEQVAVVTFPTLTEAVSTVVKVIQHDMPLQAIEFICNDGMRAVNAGGYCEKEFPEVPSLFLKFGGVDERAVREQVEKVRQFAKESNCKSFEFSTTTDEAEAIWAARKTVLWSLLTLKYDPSDGFISSDTAVPISQLARAVDEAKEKAKASGMQGFAIGHVGDGNFHLGVLYPQNKKEEARELITWVQRRAIEMNGTVTGEHGIGLEFRDMVAEELGDNGVDLMRQIKLALDPLCLLNPDKVFRLKIDGQQKSDAPKQSEAEEVAKMGRVP